MKKICKSCRTKFECTCKRQIYCGPKCSSRAYDNKINPTKALSYTHFTYVDKFGGYRKATKKFKQEMAELKRKYDFSKMKIGDTQFFKDVNEDENFRVRMTSIRNCAFHYALKAKLKRHYTVRIVKTKEKRTIGFSLMRVE